MPFNSSTATSYGSEGAPQTIEELLRAHQDALAYLRTLASFGGNLPQARALAEKGFNSVASVRSDADAGAPGISQELRALAMTTHTAAALSVEDQEAALHSIGEQLLGLAHRASASSATSVIQAAVNSVERPPKLTDKQWEWVKAGVRLLVGRVNAISSERGAVH